MKAPVWIVGCCLPLLTAAPALAQMPPVLPTDVTGVGPGSPGYPMLQMQVDNLMNSQPQPAMGVAGISSQAAVIPNGYTMQNGYLMPMQQRFYLLQDRQTGQRYLMRAY